MTFAVFALLVVSLLASATYVVLRRRTVSVSHGVRMDLAMPEREALEVAAAQFAPELWAPVAGDGDLNLQHVSPWHPALSVIAVPGEQGTELHVWLSGWSLRAGFVRHAGVARRQMRRTQAALFAADLAWAADHVHVVEPEPVVEQPLAVPGFMGMTFQDVA